MNKKSAYQNWISVIGRMGAIVAFTLLLFLLAIDLLTQDINVYVKVFLYLITPFLFFFFVLLIPIGAFFERRRFKKKGYIQHFPRIDFNNPRHQQIAYFLIGVVTFFGLFSFFGAYRTYEFTESNAFCGQVCHEVMHPEFTAYQNSPHARVDCVECHVGHGTKHYLSAKIQGLSRLKGMVKGDFDKPIKTPVLAMLPARETCETCHWSEKHFGVIGKEFSHFLSDEDNTEWMAQMLIHVSGKKERFGEQYGVHWHMNLENKTYYIASDDDRLIIPWVKNIDLDGKEEIFIDETSEFSSENVSSENIRLMDCMDCHNRASHRYLSPQKAVNAAIGQQEIVRTLPFIKREAVKQLVAKYSSHEEAEVIIRNNIQTFYREQYPDIFNEKASEIEQSIKAVITIYKENFFPKMNVSWDKYPDHIGHFIYPGCFRCHDGKHKSKEGNVISNSCNICHRIIRQGNPPEMEESVHGLEFKHPVEIGEAWKEMPCSNCHSGG